MDIAIPKCFYCGKDKNEILINKHINSTKLQDNAHGKVIDTIPCDECKDAMSKRIMLIAVKDGEEGKENPYRLGRVVVLKEEEFRRIFNTESKSRIFYIEDKLFNAMIPEDVFDELG